MSISETALESYRPEIAYKETGTLNELHLDKLLNEKSKYMVTKYLQAENQGFSASVKRLWTGE